MLTGTIDRERLILILRSLITAKVDHNMLVDNAYVDKYNRIVVKQRNSIILLDADTYEVIYRGGGAVKGSNFGDEFEV